VGPAAPVCDSGLRVSVAVESPPTEIPDGSRPVRLYRRRWLWVTSLTLVVLAGVGVGVGILVYQHNYQPLVPGSFGSMSGPHARPLTDGIQDTQIIVVGPAGTHARLTYSLANAGDHNVRLLGLPSNSGIDRITWGPALDHNQLLGGTAAEARPFPMTLHAGSMISLWVYLTQPNCGGTPYSLTGIPLRWSAYGDDHVYTLPLDNDASALPITFCAPHKALKYVDHF
jgi:hypothetical protein